MKDKLDIYNSKLFVEVKTIKESIKSEIKNKSWNTSESPTIYNSRSISYSESKTEKSIFEKGHQ